MKESGRSGEQRRGGSGSSGLVRQAAREYRWTRGERVGTGRQHEIAGLDGDVPAVWGVQRRLKKVNRGEEWSPEGSAGEPETRSRLQRGHPA